MKKLPIFLSALSMILIASQAMAIVVDDFSGDLSAYAKSVVLTNSGDDEAMSLAMTNFTTSNGELNLASWVSNSKAYQTVFLRDDYSLGVGQRLQVDLTGLDLSLDTFEIGLCVAGQKSYTFGEPRQNYFTCGLYDTNISDDCSARSVIFDGTTQSEPGRTALRSTTTGFYIDRLTETTYASGFLSTDGAERTITVSEYSGGANAVGFYVDTRRVAASLAAFDNLEIVDAPTTPVSGVAPVSCYSFSGEQSPHVVGNTFDAILQYNNKPSPYNMWVAPDATPENPEVVTGYAVYDMGEVMDIDNMTIWARDNASSLLPENVKIFGFADGNPANIQGSIDDIENDPNIIELYSGTLSALNNGRSQTLTWFDNAYNGQYIGIRVDSSYETGNFQIGEVRFNVKDAIPGLAPASCYDYSTVESTYVPEYTFDGKSMQDGKIDPSNMWVAPDDTPETTDVVTGHIVYDMGSVVRLDGMTVWARDIESQLLPENIKIFGFADDDPTNISGSIDDIENDPNIVELYSGTLEGLNWGLSQDVTFDEIFNGRYIGIRVDSSYEVYNEETGKLGNFQIGELRFHEVAGEKIAGDANNDGKVDGSDVTILAGNWQKGVGDGQTADWSEGDFNGDGKVDGSDVTILAGNWQYGVEASAASVPEPSTLVMILVGFVAFMMRKRFTS